MAFPQSRNPGRRSLDRPWEAGDSIPAPEAEHRDGDSAWALWTEVSKQHAKRLCFREQVEWAERAGVLESVMDFMQSMSEDEWLHMGED